MKRFENLFLSVHVLWSGKKFLPDYNPKDERGGNTRFLLAHLSWEKVMWLLCLLLKLIDNFVNKRWGLLGALERFCSWTLPPLSLFDHCQIILKPIYTSVAKLHMDLHMVSDLVAIHLWTKCCWVFFGDKTLCLVYRSIYLIYYYQFVHNSICTRFE